MRNWVLGAFVLAIGCGDNSRSCGVGTKVEDGVCVPSLTCGPGTIADEETGECVADGTHVCTNGTRFDVVTGACQIDPGSCQNGTVLVGDACVDPTAEMIVDLEEGPEPNGLGFVEDSTAPAGRAMLKPSGPFVVHGTIAPHGDAPDVDTYLVTVDGPTIVEISTDGVGGLAAGFAVGPRLGIDLGGDTSKARIYARAAGTFELSVGDMRTMLDHTNVGGAGEYYLSLSPFAVPPPTVVSVPSTTTGSLAHGDLALYQATFPTTHPASWYLVSLDMPAALAVGAVTISVERSTEVDGQPAQIKTQVAGTELIVVDTNVSLVPGPVSFTLTIEPTVPDL